MEERTQMTETPMINVGDWIRQWSAIRPHETAIISDDQPCSYAELNKRINRLTHFLIDAGVKKGDRVSVLLHNCKQYIEIFFCLSKLGAIIVPLNWRLATPEIKYILRDSGSSALIFEGEFAARVAEFREETELATYVVCNPSGNGPRPEWASDYESAVAGRPDDEPELEEAGDQDPHIIMYTSGTTGVPKGATLSHRKTFFNVLNSDMFYDLTTKDVMIIARPMFHSGGLIVDSAPVLYKGGTIIVRRRFSPVQILETIQKYGVTLLELPATVYQFILNECDLTRYRLDSIRSCFTGGERVPVHLLEQLAAKGLIVSQIYGLTEASTLCWLPWHEALRKMGSVGRPIFHGRIRIVDEQGRTVQPGETGEIIVKGPIVMSGYWNRQDLTDEVMKDGWFKTGDIARTDPEGFIYIMDRKKDMYISGGENVYPAEVEKVLLSHQSVADAAVVGVPDEKWGEVGKAFIVLKNEQMATADEIFAYLDGKLAKYKTPRHIEFVAALPKTASMKVRKYLLKEQ